VGIENSPNAHTRKGHRKWMAALLLQRWINRTALALLGSANLGAEVDKPLLLTRGVEPQCGVTPWLRKLDRSGALPESIFEHCVSPSPRGDRSDNALHPSQVAA
jgi:hypothetical protein